MINTNEILISTILIPVAKSFTECAIKRIQDYYNNDEFVFDPESGLKQHNRKLVSFCSTIQILEMTEPKDIRSCTVKANLTSIPRKFGGKKTGIISDEEVLINDSDNILILGDPGSGKTTALKRLALKMLENSPESEKDTNNFPIFIRLRDLEKSSAHPIFNTLEKELNIHFSNKEFTKEIIEVFNGEEKLVRITDQDKKNRANQMRCQLLMETIEALSPTIILDGFDEVNESIKEKVLIDIDILSNNLITSRLILSCRSGEKIGSLSGFKIMEICSLTNEDINNIASYWLGERKDDFFHEVESKNIGELLDRPLFLVQLIIIYKNQGYIADQPSIITEHIFYLAIKKWQEENKIIRLSKFNNFLPEQKIRFLSEFSYELTYQRKAKSFTRRDFGFIYNDICDHHSLPISQADDVAAEIESHTGIIQMVGNDKFEFSHLTLQEYLCAKYFSLLPFSLEKFMVYLKEYPAPLAIAAAISIKPSMWISNILLNINSLRGDIANNILVLLHRLMLEKPIFEVERDIGVALLKMLSMSNEVSEERTKEELVKFLEILSKNENIVRSIAKVEDAYSFERSISSDIHTLKLRSHSKSNSNNHKLPKEIKLESRLFFMITKGLHLVTREYM
ncbi:NACHT domain-containing protein [Vibrio vulnificus]|uniref:NACHT domain-containing protein n=1 Tax=Vibrio vulnificus TaxID=672 RepID=UPI00287AB09F|nr:NACHT domain-containing protein [Vibrio vulnificus]MDS1843068.1 NACHT domain-containing protein [Vibrio vulnificus]